MDKAALATVLVTCVSSIVCYYFRLQWYWYFLIAASLSKYTVLFTRTASKWTLKKPNWVQALFLTNILDFATVWHDYDVVNYRQDYNRNCLLVGYHSRPSFDLIYTVSALLPKAVLFDMIFYVPFFKHLVRMVGCIPSRSKEEFVAQLSAGNRPLLVLPGGAWECLKPSQELYQVHWKPETGYARVILEHPDVLGEKTRIVPFFTRNSESILLTTNGWLDFSSVKFRELLIRVRKGELYLLPFLFTLGIFSLGLAFLPRTVTLDTHFGEPVVPKSGETPAELTARVAAALQQLMDSVNRLPARVVRRSPLQRLFRVIVLVLYGVLTLLFTGPLFVVLMVSNFTVFPVGVYLHCWLTRLLGEKPTSAMLSE